jgi:hypothetical protein
MGSNIAKPKLNNIRLKKSTFDIPVYFKNGDVNNVISTIEIPTLNNPNNNIKNLIGEMHIDLKNYEMKNLSNSTESVYTPIDNISEFDSLDDNLNSINDEQILNEYETHRPLQRHRLNSNENYVLITDKIDYINTNDNLSELVVQNKDVVLNVKDFKNASSFMNDISIEKTCL